MFLPRLANEAKDVIDAKADPLAFDSWALGQKKLRSMSVSPPNEDVLEDKDANEQGEVEEAA